MQRATSTWNEADYSSGNLCRVCGRLICDDSEVCHEHRLMLIDARRKTDRLCELARRQRAAKNQTETNLLAINTGSGASSIDLDGVCSERTTAGTTADLAVQVA